MILVTGGSGLLGSELIKRLISKGEKVRAIYHNNPLPAFDPAYIEPVCCSILDTAALEDAMKDVQFVYHCAGYVSFSPRSTLSLNKVNVEGTANVVNIALDANVIKLVHVSSVASLGRKDKNNIVTEDIQYAPSKSASRYAQSKYLGEMEVWRAIAEGLNAVIINPSVILGGGNWDKGSTAIFKSAYNELKWHTNGTSGFVDVRDVVEAMLLLMNSEIHSERFIISAVNESFLNLTNAIADSLGKKRPVKNASPIHANILFKLEWLRSKFSGSEPFITKETAASAFRKVTYDNTKFLRYFSAFKYHSLNDTINECCYLLQQKLNKA